MNVEANTTKETLPNEETQQKISENSNAEQIKTEESGSTSGETKPEQVDFSQMYDMLKERDSTITSLKSEVAELKKTNTQLLLKVNASPSGAPTKDPFENFVDAMVNR